MQVFYSDFNFWISEESSPCLSHFSGGLRDFAGIQIDRRSIAAEDDGGLIIC